jgi:hypothetical protein
MDPNDPRDEGREPLLASPFDALRAAMALQESPRGVEKELMAAFAKQFPPKRWYQRLTPGQWGMAGGLGSTVAAVMVFMLTLHAPQPLGGVDGRGTLSLDERGDFVAIESLERIEQEADPHMVETRVARAELAALGVAVSPENAGESVRAELLVAADGAPLALRLSLP